jgi:hypothetical protein
MNTDIVPLKKPRKKSVRTVFGRIRVKMGEKDWFFEQRKDGLHFKPLHGRRWSLLSFSQIYDMHVEQFQLAINSLTT